RRHHGARRGAAPMRSRRPCHDLSRMAFRTAPRDTDGSRGRCADGRGGACRQGPPAKNGSRRMTTPLAAILTPEGLQSGVPGPLYLKLRQTLEDAITSGKLNYGDALPAERDLADHANVSRVTVRKAVDDLVKDGLLVRRHGSGTFVAKPVSKVQQSLSRLTSFTEDMARRGLTTRAEWLDR